MPTVAETLRTHYRHALERTTVHREQAYAHGEAATDAIIAGDSTAAGTARANERLANISFSHAIGALDALERLADDLGVKLEGDRRAVLDKHGFSTRCY